MCLQNSTIDSQVVVLTRAELDSLIYKVHNSATITIFLLILANNCHSEGFVEIFCAPLSNTIKRDCLMNIDCVFTKI